MDATLIQPTQLLLWMDGVGGYLLCLRPRLTIGQAGGASSKPQPDLAILADISRHHATLERGGEGYVLEAVRKTALNGQPAEKVFLHSDDRLTLGPACQLLFTQPVPISASARLDLVSGQRWLHPVQAALLMAETLVFGPGPQAHVVVEELTKPVVLFRTPAGLAVRYGGNVSVNGRARKERSPVAPGDKIAVDALSFAVENA